MTPTILLITIFAYILLLFCIARWGDRQQFDDASITHKPIVHALALGVYCTSWTFYGLVGTASEKGWNFIPILLGPILLFTLGFPLLKRIFLVCKQEHIHSIADFLSSRYGKRQGVAATVSLVALLATIPYIALQLKAVSDTLALTLGDDYLGTEDLTFITSASMIGFALLFGAKRLDVTGYHSGLMSAIAFESIIKLTVFIAIALLSFFYLRPDIIDTVVNNIIHQEQSINAALLHSPIWTRFAVETFIAMCAVFCLPRMFHVTFVECLSIEHLKKSRWIFSFYLMITTLCIFVIAWVGNLEFYNDPLVKGDTYVIALPLLNDFPTLALMAFIGGFSAATAMIIVATVTLSQMLSNDVILPLFVRRRKNKKQSHEYSRSLIFSRRFTVVFVVMGGYFYQSAFAENAALTSIGLIAFALVTQLAPAMLFGMFWKKGNARGLYAGLIVGLSIWFYTLMIPLLTQAGFVQDTWVNEGFLGLSWLRPEYLFGLTFGDEFTRGVVLSLTANVIFYWWYSITSTESFTDRVQATAFTRLQKANYELYDDIATDDLKALLEEFLGVNVTRNLFVTYEEYSRDNKNKDETKLSLVDQAQRALAGTVGIASAQAMIEGLRSGKKMAVEDVVNLFGETTKALRFNQDVLFSSFENISSGISVVDKELKLVAWNSRYQEIFNYPEGLLNIGNHISDIMRFNGSRGLFGKGGNIDDLIHKRLGLMSEGKTYRVIRSLSEDTIIEIKGMPIAHGGYVTTYDDISQFIFAQRQLEDANQNLEKRVEERTETIAEINRNLLQEIKQRSSIEAELRQAKKMADQANASKTKFLALAGHDIMQPLNAASLYISALLEDNNKNPILLSHLKQAIDNTETIISSLIEISKVDNDAVKTKVSSFPLDELLANIVYQAQAQSPKDLEIRYCPTSVNVISDKHYLRRILQNLISNSVKYTQMGKVLIGCRRRTSWVDGKVLRELEICVLDNGPGISNNEQKVIFEEFYRSDRHQQQDNIPGIGLGLSVVKRFSDLLNHKIACRSALHRGSLFSITVPIAPVQTKIDAPLTSNQSQDVLEGLKVLYVDDDPQNLLATSSLLEHWQCEVVVLNNVASAREYAHSNTPPQVVLMDYQLGDKVSGLDLAKELIDIWQEKGHQGIAVCIVSAANQADLPEQVDKCGFDFLSKPIKPGKLRALLTQFSHRAQSE